MFRKFSPGFSRAANRLLRSLPGIQHTTATAADPDAATTMEKLELNRSVSGFLIGRVFLTRTARSDRPQCVAPSAFDEVLGRFLPCLPLRKRMSISVPLTRTSSHRR